jgi:hypothetical protein
MKKYFYIENNSTLGPFTFDELAAKRLSSNTLVWFEGQSGWKGAYEIPEVKDAFIATPPAPPSSGQYIAEALIQKESRTKDLMVVLVLGFMLLGGVVMFAFQKIVHEWYRPPLYYITAAYNLIYALLPVIISLSIRNKNLKAIGLVISIILALFNIGTTVTYMITFLNR